MCIYRPYTRTGEVLFPKSLISVPRRRAGFPPPSHDQKTLPDLDPQLHKLASFGMIRKSRLDNLTQGLNCCSHHCSFVFVYRQPFFRTCNSCSSYAIDGQTNRLPAVCKTDPLTGLLICLFIPITEAIHGPTPPPGLREYYASSASRSS